jgi:hypothetical protein
VIVLLTIVVVPLRLPAMSAIFPLAMLAIMVPSLVAVVVTSNAVPSLGVISSILIQVCPGAVPIKSISSQVNVPVCIASENVIRNVPVRDILGEICPLARLIVANGFVVSTKCDQRFEKVSCGYSSRSTEGSKISPPLASPIHMVALRTKVRFTVVTHHEFHELPGSKPICQKTST